MTPTCSACEREPNCQLAQAVRSFRNMLPSGRSEVLASAARACQLYQPKSYEQLRKEEAGE